MKKILVPTDLSEIADNGMNYAAALARFIGAEITLLNVESALVTDSEYMSPEMLNSMEEQRNRKLESMKQKTDSITEDYGIAAYYEVQMSNLENAILEYSKDFDLIVMGTSGEETLEQYFFGSHSYHIIKKSTKPVLIVPYEVTFVPFENVVYASDYKAGDQLALKQFLRFSRPFKPKVHVLHVSQKKEEVEEEVFHAFADLIVDIFPDDHQLLFDRLVSKDIANGIDDFVNEIDADLLVMNSEHRSFFEKLFHKSVTRELAAIANYPLLVFHE